MSPVYMEPTIPQHPYISSVEASKRFGITNDYAAALCRRGKVEGKLVGRLWFVNEESLRAYLDKMQEQRMAQRKVLRKAWQHAWAVGLVFVVVMAPQARASGLIDADTLVNLPDAMIDTTYNAELAIGQGYWDLIAGYVKATYQVRDAAAAVVATIANPQQPASMVTPTPAPAQAGENITAQLTDMAQAASVALASADLHPTYAASDSSAEPTYQTPTPTYSSSLEPSWLAYLPHSMVETTYGIAQTISDGYWDAVSAYVKATYRVRDAAAAVVATIANPQQPAATPATVATEPTQSNANISIELNGMMQAASVALVSADLHPTYEAPSASAPTSFGPVDLSWLAYLPDSMIETTYGIEQTIGDNYWRAITAYVVTSRGALDAAAAMYNQDIQTFVDSTYAMRDLSAAAYGGVAEATVSGITSVHDSQVRTMQGMADSMADGAVEVGALYDGLAQWYAQSDANIAERLSAH